MSGEYKIGLVLSPLKRLERSEAARRSAAQRAIDSIVSDPRTRIKDKPCLACSRASVRKACHRLFTGKAAVNRQNIVQLHYLLAIR